MALIPPPPGPVGVGPGYWTFDAWGGQWRNDWVQVGDGYLLSGENGTPGPPGPRAMPTEAAVQRSEQASPHFNSALAKAYAATNPLLGTEVFDLRGQGYNNLSYNPDIAALAGVPLTQRMAMPTSDPRYTAPPPGPPGTQQPAAPKTPANPTGQALFTPPIDPNAGWNQLPGGYAGQGNTPTSPFDPGDSVLANAVARARTGGNATSALDILTKRSKLPRRRRTLPTLGL